MGLFAFFLGTLGVGYKYRVGIRLKRETELAPVWIALRGAIRLIITTSC